MSQHHKIAISLKIGWENANIHALNENKITNLV